MNLRRWARTATANIDKVFKPSQERRGVAQRTRQTLSELREVTDRDAGRSLRMTGRSARRALPVS
jgi:hypothetical protein